ncbi:CheY chemotaxis protein or a CheY-like REC (receiver) domain [Candidatus Kryptonium thompsonii]|uniref:CheY chemotaxis protein or a CheY-like REC (Receiver) domain n=2 Tax=Candidatus Kryptonium thompsonii TaxID=1633631 RepID=A0A0P1MDF3_9BACT|nr:response regulator [Candidatus Kryptonium thompsoni]CUS79250.1 CheY chemotaxis protein or a CheY-like REC (receiver) domain [Candidatus Kryptonium thompsoni]CUS82270.1 CheY chemotaxis protein or a CheY-like REC (receiver) domain [Candidatus Kryptonium thompsoni]CUS82951.1 CheY chemotaxis protein or a CheY-like REC (receiver) domain [Candidatus Kryptonium thompsoni]CUS83277.1 CheY chemotaxis protein or a CheY-like REC (receiver) domain [Candidatus Kryptonium thompsoni]CUS93208.1 CheY chemota
MVHVLVVEDDAMTAQLFKIILERKGGFKVTVTDNGEEIINLLNSGDVNLIIMDVSLPGTFVNGVQVDGLKLSRMIKENEITSKIPIILATAHAMRGDAERFLEESKADDYIPKPIVDHNLLIEKVKKYLQNE